ncbi:hypothetical protein [Thiomicrorhabdus sp. Milos-T2]|uniref:hypothetical protein n=1 Tax=Thiomicrorhabdus sp. Milos-T2 TaxID=90814 RepID=UPI0004947FB4|nr:hypothetical protein [Thiomicrorhabdus sp. Milos-T2]
MSFPRSDASWQDSEEKILVRHFEAGIPTEEIAIKHLRSPEAIKMKLFELGFLSSTRNSQEQEVFGVGNHVEEDLQYYKDHPDWNYGFNKEPRFYDPDNPDWLHEGVWNDKDG